MKKAIVIITNLLVICLIFFFIVQYTFEKTREGTESVISSYEKMTLSTEQILTNYLESEQHLCDAWANYINRSAAAGEPLTVDETMNFIRRVLIAPGISGQLVFADSENKIGVSATPKSTDPDDYSVSYKRINIFDSILTISDVDGDVNLTRAYTNPMTGVQSIAFLNNVTVYDENEGRLRSAILLRVVPVSDMEEKLVFLKGKYENVEVSLIDKDGNYLVRGKSFKNKNFFEYYKSYNPATAAEYNEFVSEVTGGTGSVTIKNSKGENCLIAYTPLRSSNIWYLVTYAPEKELQMSRSVDWILLGTVSAGLIFLLVFNFLILMLYNRRLAEVADEANRANKAKSYFLSTMSHDIRTPMNAILGLNEMILRETDEEKVSYYAENIHTSGNTLLGIINDILDFSKIEAGKMDIIEVDYNLASVLNDLMNMVQTRAESKGLELKTEVDRNIPIILRGDEIRIKQIITNILSNAVKYTREGSIKFSVGYEKLADEEDKINLKVSVADTGIGIKPEDLEKLFVAFQRIEEKKNRDIEGTGLGMTIAQSFLNMMGSSLQVESEYGKGSVFSFVLQQSVVKWEPIGDYEETFRNSLANRAEYKEKFIAPLANVLVVDDTPVNLTVFTSLLSKTRIKIDTAESGDEGLALYRRKHYDVIFLDHMMPNKDGIETLKEMKAIEGSPNATTPVICLTANAVSGMREMYINAGFDDYMTKPIDPNRLENMLLAYLPKGKIAPATEDTEDENYAIPDFIFKIDDLDVNSGLSHCGSRESYIATLKMYLETAEKNVQEIEQYWAAKDIKNTTIKIHALKSTSRVVGALELGEFAARLEKAGENREFETLDANISKLLAQYKALARELAPLSSAGGADEKAEAEKPVVTAETLQKAYTSLLSLVEEFDFDGVVDVVEELSGYQMPEDEATRFAAIKKAADNFDYELIPKILGSEESGGENG